MVGIIVVGVSIIAISAIYVYFQPKNIDKTFKMINLNGINDTYNKVKMGQLGLVFKVNISMSINKSILNRDTFTGILTINDELEYKVISTTKLGDKYLLVFINNQNPNNYAGLEFTLLQRNQFESVVINEIVINGEEYLLAGCRRSISLSEEERFFLILSGREEEYNWHV